MYTKFDFKIIGHLDKLIILFILSLVYIIVFSAACVLQVSFEGAKSRNMGNIH